MPRFAICILGWALLVSGAACGGSPTASTQTSSPALVSVSVAGTAPNVGATAQFTATANLSNGTSQSVTSQASWQSSNTAVATVSSSGLVAATGTGQADITATYQNVTGRLSLTIARPAVSMYTISGTVTDGTSGGVLPNIDILAADSTGKTLATKTGATGTFTLAGVAAGTVSLTAAAVSYESATLTVPLTSDQRVDIVLKRVTCAFSVTPSTFSFTSAPGQGTVTVASQAAGCSWTARSNDPFLTIISGGSGLDNGVLSFAVSGNPVANLYLFGTFTGGVARSGTMTIGGMTVAVRQDAPRLRMAVYDPALMTSVCQDPGEGCAGGLPPSTTLFNACPAGSGGSSLRIGPPLVQTQDGSPLTSGKPVAIVVQAPGLQILRVFVAGDAQHPSWVPLGPVGLISNTWWVGTNLVLSSTAGLQAVRVTYSDSTSVGPGPCGDLDNYDLVFRVQ